VMIIIYIVGCRTGCPNGQRVCRKISGWVGQEKIARGGGEITRAGQLFLAAHPDRYFEGTNFPLTPVKDYNFHKRNVFPSSEDTVAKFSKAEDEKREIKMKFSH